MSELQKLEDLYAMGFIQEEEYLARKGELSGADAGAGGGVGEGVGVGEEPPSVVEEPPCALAQPARDTSSAGGYDDPYSPTESLPAYVPEKTREEKQREARELLLPKIRATHPSRADKLVEMLLSSYEPEFALQLTEAVNAGKLSAEISNMMSALDLNLGSEAESPFRWADTASGKSKNLEVLEGGMTVTNKGGSGSLNIIRANKPLKGDVQSFSVKVLDLVPGGVMCVGLCRVNMSRFSYVGGPNNGWGYASNGHKVYSDTFTKYAKVETYGKGDVIRAVWDPSAKTLSFLKNGKDLGVAFQNVGTGLYPAVTVPGPDKGPLSKQFTVIQLV